MTERGRIVTLERELTCVVSIMRYVSYHVKFISPEYLYGIFDLSSTHGALVQFLEETTSGAVLA